MGLEKNKGRDWGAIKPTMRPMIERPEKGKGETIADCAQKAKGSPPSSERDRLICLHVKISGIVPVRNDLETALQRKQAGFATGGGLAETGIDDSQKPLSPAQIENERRRRGLPS